MKIGVVLTLVFFCFFAACGFMPEKPIHIRRLDEIIAKFVSDVEEKYSISLCSKGGSISETINVVSLSFVTKVKPKSQDELRILIAIIVEDFLNRMNSNKEIRQYLLFYSFAPFNLDFRIISRDSAVFLFKENLLFINKNNSIYPEPYSEVLANIKNEHPDLFETKKESSIFTDDEWKELSRICDTITKEEANR